MTGAPPSSRPGPVGPREPAWQVALLASVLCSLSGLAQAQPAPAPTPAPLPVMDAASLPAGISERLRREAERPMYWIKVHGEADKPEPRRAAPAPVRGEPVKPEPVRAEPVRAEAPKSEPAKAAAIARSTPATPAPATASPVAPPEATPAPVAQSTPELPTPAQQTRSPGPLADNAPAPELAPPALTQAAVPENAASQEGKGDTQLASAAPSLPPPPRPDIKPPVAEALELLSSSQPQFPQALMRQLRKGELQVEVDVSTDGTVADARVLSSSHPRLESAALSAIRTWQFKPPARPTSAVINFSFDLDS